MMSGSELALEFILGLGVALLGANLFVLLRPYTHRREERPNVPRPRSLARVWASIAIGAAIALWAAIALLAR
jgi:hypothetical protein